MTGYTRVYNESTGQTVEASDFNTEFQSIDDAFDESTGHKHDGSNDEGAYVPLISDSDNNNSVEIDTGNNEIDFNVEVSSSKTRQMVLTDGALLPDTDDDLDLGSATYQFKDAYIDGTANIDSLVADTADINGGTIDGATVGGSSAGAGTFTNLTATGTVTLPADSVDTDDIAAGALPSDVTVNDDNWSGTDLAIANGGTGASTAANARTALGVGTGDSPQFAAVNIGHASDTTVSRASSGDINVEGNIVYRAGGTDVPVTDGGTGASDASGARTNLGLGSIATQASSNVSITGGSIAGITDLAVADGGTGASTASGARTNLGVSTFNATFDLIYPVGSIHLSTSATNPGTSMGRGTWTQIARGRTLIGEGTSDQTFTAAATGGASTHTLTIDEMPAHTHTHPWVTPTGSGYPGHDGSGDNAVSGNTGSTGGGSAHNNLPPYLVVYIWERTA